MSPRKYRDTRSFIESVANNPTLSLLENAETKKRAAEDSSEEETVEEKQSKRKMTARMQPGGMSRKALEARAEKGRETRRQKAESQENVIVLTDDEASETQESTAAENSKEHIASMIMTQGMCKRYKAFEHPMGGVNMDYFERSGIPQIYDHLRTYAADRDRSMFAIFEELVTHVDRSVDRPHRAKQRFMGRSAIRCYLWAFSLGVDSFRDIFANFGWSTNRWAAKFTALFLLPRINIDCVLNENGELEFSTKTKSQTNMVVSSQEASFSLLQIFRHFELGETPGDALYEKFDTGHWGILMAYSDVYRDIVIPEWNQKNEQFRLKYREDLLLYFSKNEAKIRAKKSEMKKEAERTSYFKLVEEIMLEIEGTIDSDKTHPFWTEDYEIIKTTFESDWKNRKNKE